MGPPAAAGAGLVAAAFVDVVEDEVAPGPAGALSAGLLVVVVPGALPPPKVKPPVEGAAPEAAAPVLAVPVAVDFDAAGAAPPPAGAAGLPNPAKRLLLEPVAGG